MTANQLASIVRSAVIASMGTAAVAESTTPKLTGPITLTLGTVTLADNGESRGGNARFSGKLTVKVNGQDVDLFMDAYQRAHPSLVKTRQTASKAKAKGRARR